MPSHTLMPRAFLKNLGFIFDKSPSALDKAFLKSFPETEREKVEMAWFYLHNGLAKEAALYALPQTEKQSALLFSHDRERLTSSLDWLGKVVERTRPASVAELGCGAGYLLRYLRHSNPSVELAGIDQQQNLLNLIPQEEKIRTYQGDYRTLPAAKPHDLVICDFGWDNSDIPASSQPHSKASIGGLGYCPGCSDDAIPFFERLIGACQEWTAEDGHIALTGRLGNMGMVRALYLAAEHKGWKVTHDGFMARLLRHDRATIEKFPSFIFSRMTGEGLALEEIANIYAAP